jgi:hypothetical protein
LKVGEGDKIYFVHPGIFASSALSAEILGYWKGTADDTVNLTEYDEQTIESALSYFYTKDYYLAQITPEIELAAEADASPDNSQFTGEELPVEEDTDGKKSVNFFGRLVANLYIKRTQQNTLRMFQHQMMLK